MTNSAPTVNRSPIRLCSNPGSAAPGCLAELENVCVSDVNSNFSAANPAQTQCIQYS